MKLLKERAAEWVRNTYGEASLMDRKNRAARVFEEACELLQAEGGDRALADAIVARCYSRPVGEPKQEAAGVQFTLLMWAFASKTNIEEVTWAELERVKSIDPDHFRKKQAEKHAAGTDLMEPQPIYCHGCSQAGGAERPIYHLPPACSEAKIIGVDLAAGPDTTVYHDGRGNIVDDAG